MTTRSRWLGFSESLSLKREVRAASKGVSAAIPRFCTNAKASAAMIVAERSGVSHGSARCAGSPSSSAPRRCDRMAGDPIRPAHAQNRTLLPCTGNAEAVSTRCMRIAAMAAMTRPLRPRSSSPGISAARPRRKNDAMRAVAIPAATPAWIPGAMNPGPKIVAGRIAPAAPTTMPRPAAVEAPFPRRNPAARHPSTSAARNTPSVASAPSTPVPYHASQSRLWKEFSVRPIGPRQLQ